MNDNINNLIQIYKIKYLDSDIDNFNFHNNLIITHNSRIRCWLHQLNPEYFDQLLKIYSTDNIRFKNCAILKIEFYNSLFRVSLIWDGFIDKRKSGKYYTNNQSNLFDDVFFIPLTISLSKLDINPSDIKLNNFVFYIMRHAESTHNISSTKLIDPELTQNGKIQAGKTGDFLKTFLLSESNNFFISKLRRTHQTMFIILDKLNLTGKKQIFVLPCTHEIKYFTGGKCQPRNKENPSDTMICNPLDKICRDGHLKNNINWDYYTDFYLNNKKCFQTNMIKLVLNFI